MASDILSRETATSGRAQQVFDAHRQRIFERTDHLFAGLMVFQWLLGIAFALWVSPKTWEGAESRIHVHVWSAVFLGGAIAALPVALSLLRPGTTLTRHAIAVGQMLAGALLIHLTGGRIETHFHVFGSLAFLAFYRDWRVLVSASSVVVIDHFFRGVFWPQSVYGVLASAPWRALEHGAWVLFEDVVLIGSCEQSLREMREIAERQAGLEAVNSRIESEVVARTAELGRTEASFKATEVRFRALVEKSSDGILLIRRDAEIHYASESALAMLRRSGAEVVGSDLFRFVHPEDLRHVRERFAQCLDAPGEEVAAEFRVGREDGEWRSMEAVAVNRFSEPAVNAVVANFRDVTERKRAEDALRRSEEQLLHSQKMEAVGRLAGGVAHDFNNLLNVIIGYGQLITKKLAAGDSLRPKIAEIVKAGERAAGLTEQLLAFSRKQVRKPRVLDLNVVVADMHKMLCRLISEDVDLGMVMRHERAHVLADQGQLEQVIMNLAVNARDAMPEGGRLTIETAVVELRAPSGRGSKSADTTPFVMLAVSDEGVGMDKATQARIFEPFFTTKEEGKGTGLGLATVYGIVEQSGGHILLYSEPGRGTTFKVYFPAVAQPQAELAAPAEVEEAPRGTETVLLVENEDALRYLAREILETSGYDVIDASNGEEAIRKCRDMDADIHLLLTDVVMPGKSGPDLAEELRRSRPETRVLFMSGYAEGALVHQGVVNAGVSIVQKPFTPDQLACKVRDALDAVA